MKASRLLFASPLDIPASEEMDSINCVLFILSRSCDGDTDGSAGRGQCCCPFHKITKNNLQIQTLSFRLAVLSEGLCLRRRPQIQTVDMP